METCTAVSTKTIQRRLSQEFGLKSCKSAQKLRLTQAIKKKCFGLRQETCWLGHKDVKKGNFFGRVFCTADFCSKILGLEPVGAHYEKSTLPQL